jgi:hypothetical protein
LEAIFRQASKEYCEIQSGRSVVTIDPLDKVATDNRGKYYSNQKLLLPTGGTPGSINSASMAASGDYLAMT